MPRRVLAVSAGALAVPVVAWLFFPDTPGQYEVLLWLCALVPAFLMAYHRGWRGVALTDAVMMVSLALAQAARLSLGRGSDGHPVLVGVVAAYIAVTLGLGWLVERMRRERLVAEEMALTDALTGLPNRRHARLALERDFAAARRGRSLTVVFYDLDRFKDYNDRFGHAAGDEKLKTFAQALGGLARQMDLAARYGGEEFLAILSPATEDGALVFVERVRKRLREIQVQGDEITVSAGVASYRDSMGTVDELLAAADEALYRAKRDGRDCVRVWEGRSVVARDQGERAGARETGVRDPSDRA